MRAAWVLAVAACYHNVEFTPDATKPAPDAGGDAHDATADAGSGSGSAACTPTMFSPPTITSMQAQQVSITDTGIGVAQVAGGLLYLFQAGTNPSLGAQLTTTPAWDYPGVVATGSDELSLFAGSGESFAMSLMTSNDDGDTFGEPSAVGGSGFGGTPSVDEERTVHVFITSTDATTMSEYTLVDSKLVAMGPTYEAGSGEMFGVASLYEGATLLVYLVIVEGDTEFQVRYARRTNVTDGFTLGSNVVLDTTTAIDTPVLSADCGTLYLVVIQGSQFAFTTGD